MWPADYTIRDLRNNADRCVFSPRCAAGRCDGHAAGFRWTRPGLGGSDLAWKNIALDDVRPQDLQSMIDRLEQMARSGARDAAKQLLQQLQSMLDNLQMAQPGQMQNGGDDEMQQALDELGDMIRKQQQLRDKTFKQGQDSRRDRMRGKQQGDQSMSDLQQDQQALRDRLKKLQEDLAKRGLAQNGQKGQKGQKGEQGQQGQGQQGQGDQDADQGGGVARAIGHCRLGSVVHRVSSRWGRGFA